MKHLEVAEEICREVQGKWDYDLIEQRDDLSYRCKFPCPRCGKEARETMTRVVTGKRIEDDKWLLDWSSKCDTSQAKTSLWPASLCQWRRKA